MRIFSTFCLVFFLSALQAQNTTVKGTVKDAKGSPVPGASVQLKRTSTGTVTNTAGEFSLRLKALPCTLVFSAVGFRQTEARISDTNKLLNIVLPSSGAELNEAVVIGYGTSHRRDVTGATASIVTEGLAGRAAGVSVRASPFSKAKKPSALQVMIKAAALLIQGEM